MKATQFSANRRCPPPNASEEVIASPEATTASHERHLSGVIAATSDLQGRVMIEAASGATVPRGTASGRASTAHDLTLSVESRCGAVTVGLSIAVAAPFGWRCPMSQTMAPFPHPAHR
jgi:hypothetical protein